MADNFRKEDMKKYILAILLLTSISFGQSWKTVIVMSSSAVANPYGTEYVINGLFTENTTGWTAGTSTIHHYTSDYNGVGRTYCLLDSATGANNVRVYALMADTMEVDSTYNVRFDYYIPSTNTTGDQVSLYLYVSSTEVVTVGAVKDAWTSIDIEYTVVSQWENYFNLRITDNGITSTITAGDKFYLDNISIRKVLDP